MEEALVTITDAIQRSLAVINIRAEPSQGAPGYGETVTISQASGHLRFGCGWLSPAMDVQGTDRPGAMSSWSTMAGMSLCQFPFMIR